MSVVTPTAAAGLNRAALLVLRTIAVAEIKVDQRAQSRASLDTEAVSEYAQAMRDGAQFPPLVVFYDGDAHWLAEGFHRFGAAREAELETIACEIRPGTLRDAILHSVGANSTHGLRRSNADKRRAVTILLEDELVSVDPETGAPWSNREIARRCAVDEGLVRKMRPTPLSADGPQIDPARTVSRGGNVYTMDTAAIGRKPIDPPPEISADEPAAAGPQAGAEPSPEPTNVIALAPRLPDLPTPEAIERKLLAEEIAEEFEQSEDYDPSLLEHRALSINGALSKFDHVPLTGREYWQVYGKSPDREIFIVWVRSAKKTIDDIMKEYKND